MTTEATAEIVIDLPRAEAWEKLRDISRAHHYVPGIVRTEIVSDQAEGVGASRYVYRNKRSYIQETVEEWNEGSGFLIRLHRGDKPAPPFKDAWFRYEFTDQDPGHTLFRATLGYSLPLGALGAWLEPKLQKFIAATVADIAASMKLYYETGQPTTSAALRAYKNSSGLN